MILTIGHSTRALDDFVDMLRANDVTVLIDIRRFPGSRRQPQFNSESLAAALKEAGIEYEHVVELGGRRVPSDGSTNHALRNPQFRGYADHMATPEFQTALDRLLERGKTDVLAVMCAEAVPWRCHRSLLADAITARGVPVEHIIGARNRLPHRPTKGMRAEGPDVTYPARDDQPRLPLT